MEPRTRFILLVSTVPVFSILAIAGIVFAIDLVRFGAYPPAGEGSLGHVGAVVAGLASGFVALIFGLLALWAGLRARAIRRLEPSQRNDSPIDLAGR